MCHRILATLGVALIAANASAQSNNMFPKVELETNHGNIVLELDGRKAPITVGNFVSYVRKGHYDGTAFHRVISGFMIQGGGYDGELAEKTTANPIPNESGNGLRNARGTIAMARTGDPHSGRAQFFINLVDNEALDPNPKRWGYAVFGQVVEGMDTVDKIAALPTGPKGRFPSDVPKTDAIIVKARVVE